MSITRTLQLWAAGDCWQELDQVSIVLHTGCVNYPLGELQQLARLPVHWLIPDNVRVELELLRARSSEYGTRAGLILEQARRCNGLGTTAEGMAWDLEQLYRNRRGSLEPDSISWGTLIFLFGTAGKMYEFVGSCIPLPGHYLLWRSGEALSVRSLSSLEGLERMRQESKDHWSGSRVSRLNQPVQVEPLKKLRRIRCVDMCQSPPAVITQIPGGMLHATGQQGTYARLYARSSWPGRVIKIYRNRMGLVGSSRDKLRCLAEYTPRLGLLPLAMPLALLNTEAGPFDRDGACIGYVMRELRGRPLLDFYTSGWDGYDLYEILRQIAWLLLELHCRDILVNDLSYNNILIDERGRVAIVDCDSFQIGTFPGGAITENYRHPEIEAAACSRTLHQPRHECFAFAVLVYQCAMLTDPLCTCGGDPELDPNWNNTRFPLEWDTKTSDAVSPQVLRSWLRQDDRFRRTMAEVFHLRADHSIGAILRNTELM